jgi:hypothetical protein
MRLRIEDSCGLRILADSGLTAIEDRRLSEDRGETRSAHILNPPLIADPRWLLVLRPQSSRIFQNAVVQLDQTIIEAFD